MPAWPRWTTIWAAFCTILKKRTFSTIPQSCNVRSRILSGRVALVRQAPDARASIRVPMMMRYPEAHSRRHECATKPFSTSTWPRPFSISPACRAPAIFKARACCRCPQTADPSFRKDWYYHYYQSGQESPQNRGIRTEQLQVDSLLGPGAAGVRALRSGKRSGRRDESLRKSERMRHTSRAYGIVCWNWRPRFPSDPRFSRDGG